MHDIYQTLFILPISFSRKVKQIKYFIDFFCKSAAYKIYGRVLATYVKCIISYIYVYTAHICSQEREIVSSL